MLEADLIYMINSAHMCAMHESENICRACTINAPGVQYKICMTLAIVYIFKMFQIGTYGMHLCGTRK
jgi:hypothetical protein